MLRSLRLFCLCPFHVCVVESPELGARLIRHHNTMKILQNTFARAPARTTTSPQMSSIDLVVGSYFNWLLIYRNTLYQRTRCTHASECKQGNGRLRTLLAVREHFACNRNSHVSLRADFSVSGARARSFSLSPCMCVSPNTVHARRIGEAKRQRPNA